MMINGRLIRICTCCNRMQQGDDPNSGITLGVRATDVDNVFGSMSSHKGYEAAPTLWIRLALLGTKRRIFGQLDVFVFHSNTNILSECLVWFWFWVHQISGQLRMAHVVILKELTVVTNEHNLGLVWNLRTTSSVQSLMSIRFSLRRTRRQRQGHVQRQTRERKRWQRLRW